MVDRNIRLPSEHPDHIRIKLIKCKKLLKDIEKNNPNLISKKGKFFLGLPSAFKLTRIESHVLRFILKSDGTKTLEVIGQFLIDSEVCKKPVGISTINTHLSNIRKKTKPFGIHILTIVSSGVYMTEDSKKIIRSVEQSRSKELLS